MEVISRGALDLHRMLFLVQPDIKLARAALHEKMGVNSICGDEPAAFDLIGPASRGRYNGSTEDEPISGQ